MALLRIAWSIARLVVRLGGTGLGFLWARRRATRHFYRRLSGAGIPPEVARELAQGYHGPDLRELLGRSEKTGEG